MFQELKFPALLTWTSISCTELVDPHHFWSVASSGERRPPLTSLLAAADLMSASPVLHSTHTFRNREWPASNSHETPNLQPLVHRLLNPVQLSSSSARTHCQFHLQARTIEGEAGVSFCPNSDAELLFFKPRALRTVAWNKCSPVEAEIFRQYRNRNISPYSAPGWRACTFPGLPFAAEYHDLFSLSLTKRESWCQVLFYGQVSPCGHKHMRKTHSDNIGQFYGIGKLEHPVAKFAMKQKFGVLEQNLAC